MGPIMISLIHIAKYDALFLNHNCIVIIIFTIYVSIDLSLLLHIRLLIEMIYATIALCGYSTGMSNYRLRHYLNSWDPLA